MTRQNEAARAIACPDRGAPIPDSQGESPVKVPQDPGRIKRRHRTPPGVLKVRGNDGRVLVFLWSMAPWSLTDGAAFVWPRLATIGDALGLWPSVVGRAIARLKAAGWIYRDTRQVRFDGRMVDRLGFVLNPEPDNGELFARVERELAAGEVEVEGRVAVDDDGDVVAAAPHVAVEVPPHVAVSPSFTGTRTDQNSSSAGAREPGEDDEDEDGYRDDKGTRLPPPPTFTPRPKPTPPPDGPPPAAEDLDLWQAHERERSTALGDARRMCPRPGELGEVEGLVRYVEAREGLQVEAARVRVASFGRALVANAARATREGNAWASAFRMRCTVGTWAPDLYERVVARGEVTSTCDPKTSWRAREFSFDDGRPPITYDEPELAPARTISDDTMAQIAKRTFAEIPRPS